MLYLGRLFRASVSLSLSGPFSQGQRPDRICLISVRVMLVRGMERGGRGKQWPPRPRRKTTTTDPQSCRRPNPRRGRRYRSTTEKEIKEKLLPTSSPEEAKWPASFMFQKAEVVLVVGPTTTTI